MPLTPRRNTETLGPTATEYKCQCCKELKPVSEFHKKNCPRGHQTTCGVCASKKTRDRHNSLSDATYLHSLAKYRTKRNGRLFTITVEDVEAVMSYTCPYLNIPIRRYCVTPGVGRGKRQPKDDSISLDRIDSSKGYTPDNIIVCSWRANNLLSNATADEMALLTINFHRILNERPTTFD